MKKNKLKMFTFAAMAILGSLNVLSTLAAYMIAKIWGGLSFPVSNASSIGVIGGADGPTAVFVTASMGPVWELILWIFVAAVGVFGILRIRKMKSK